MGRVRDENSYLEGFTLKHKKKTYSEKLQDPRWQRQRLEIMQRDNFTCQTCGDTKTTLQIHHIRYAKGKEPSEYDNDMLITLCGHCHDILETFLDYAGSKNVPSSLTGKELVASMQAVKINGNRIIFAAISGFNILAIYGREKSNKRRIIHK